MSERRPRKAIIECVDGPEMLGFNGDDRPSSVVSTWLDHHDAIEDEQHHPATSGRSE